jgi:hypothetical protein
MPATPSLTTPSLNGAIGKIGLLLAIRHGSIRLIAAHAFEFDGSNLEISIDMRTYTFGRAGL